MFSNPIYTPAFLRGLPSIGGEHGHLTTHRSLEDSSPARLVPIPPPPTPCSSLASPFRTYSLDDFSCYDSSSRDSSYSFVRGGNPYQTLMQASRIPDLSSDLPDMARHTKGQLHVVNPAFTPINTRADETKDMLPPPLPSPAFSTRLSLSSQRSLDQSLMSQFINRDMSRGSDISMHVDCNAFPLCTSEDQHGHVHHKSPPAPATVVRSKKSAKVADEGE